jgi:phosphatidate cytidylyltransferase
MPDREGGVSQSPKWQDLGVRTVSAAVLMPIVLIDIWLGGVWFEVFVLLIGVLIAREWVRLALADEDLQFGLHALAVLAAGVLPVATGFMMALAVVAVIWLVSAMAARKTSRGAIWPYLGIPYAAGSTMALMILGNDVANGPLAIVWLLAIVWTADSLAYFSGRIIGGPRLAPSISPKKTWAGMAGAVAGGVLASLAVAVLAGLESRVFLALLGGLLAIVEQGGDLFKSALKRFYGVKDAGHLIPGHGGVMDRVDGLVAAAMVGALIGTLHSGSGAAGAGLLHW